MKIVKREASKAKQSRTVCICNDGELIWKLDQRRQVFGQVLQVDGWEPPRLRIVPLVDVQRGDLSRVLGSVRNLRSDGSRILGELVFARSQIAKDTALKWDDFHLGHLEVEVEPLAYETVKSWHGVEGPVRVVSRWRIICVCLKAAAGLG